MMSRAQIKKQNKCNNVITNRNNKHNHRANKQNGKQYKQMKSKMTDYSCCAAMGQVQAVFGKFRQF